MTDTSREIDYVALGNFRYFLRRFLRFSRQYLADKANLSPEQYEALLALRAFAPTAGMLVGELSERLQIKHHSVVGLVDKLMMRKLVTKKRGETDRRRVHVQLTDAGVELLEALAGAHQQELRQRSAEMIEALRRIQKD
jgi:DNA-binding MarR family transcriptional regulator